MALPSDEAWNGLNIDLQTRLVRSGSLLYSHIDSDVTMMSIETGRYYSLSSVGARVWALLEQPACGDEICRRLETEYSVEPGRCETEVLDLLQKMAQEGVVEVVPSSGQEQL